MGIVDILLMGLILAGAIYLLYNSLWKKKGQCAGCSDGSCKDRKAPFKESDFQRKT